MYKHYTDIQSINTKVLQKYYKLYTLLSSFYYNTNESISILKYDVFLNTCDFFQLYKKYTQT